MKPLPALIQAEYIGGFQVHVTFDDGIQGVIDFHEWLDGPVFEPLKDQVFFRRFFIDGGTIAWPNGADIAPESLYEEVKTNVNQ